MAKSPGKCRCFNTMVFALDCGKRTAAKRLQVCGGEKVWGKYRGTTMNQTVRIGQLEKSSSCRYRNVRPHSLPAESRSFVGMARETAAMPPALEKGGGGNDGSEPFGTGGDTHTYIYVYIYIYLFIHNTMCNIYIIYMYISWTCFKSMPSLVSRACCECPLPAE